MLSSLLLSAFSGSAEEDQDQPKTKEEDTSSLSTFREEVVVRARPLASLTTAVTVIDREAILASDARTVAELVRYAPGVHVVGNGARGGLAAAQVRGGDPNLTLVLLDGVPLNNITNVEGGAVNLDSLPVTDVERIEVARGPLSYFYGSSALAGVINIVTRRGSEGPPQLEANIEAGNASQLRASSSFSGVNRNTDYYLGLGWDEEEGRIEEDRFSQLNAQGSVGFSLPGEARLRLATRFANTDVDDYPEASGGPVFGSGETRQSKNKELSTSVDLTIPTTERWDQRFTVSFYRNDLDRDSPGVFPIVPPSIEKTVFSRTRVGWLTSGQLLNWIQLSGGVDAEFENGENDSILILPPVFGGETPGNFELSRTTPGLFAEVVTERGGLVLEGGLRVDLPEELSSELSPRLAARYRLSRGTVLRGSASRAFKLPSFFVLGTPRQLGGNPELKPETSVGGDVGLDHEVTHWGLKLGAAIFHTRYRDLVDFDFETFQFVNRASVEATGLELSLDWHPRELVQVETALTWQSVEDRVSAQPPLHQPDWFGSARLTLRPRPALKLNLEFRFASESLDLQIPVPERDSVRGYGALDLAASWKLSRQWTLRGRIDNLTDKTYERFIGFPEPGLSARIGVHFSLHRRLRADEDAAVLAGTMRRHR